MSLKKTICAAISLCMATGGGFLCNYNAHAYPTRSIVSYLEYEDYADREAAIKIIKRTRYFIQKEYRNVKFYDSSSVKRLDSLAFCYFCYLCLLEDKEEFSSLVNKAVAMRDQDENEEDVNVIDLIFPQNASEFGRRFGIKLDERIRSQVSERIHRWCPDAGTKPEAKRHRKDRTKHGYVRKPTRELLERFRDGLLEYCDMLESDMYVFYSDSETDDSDME